MSGPRRRAGSVLREQVEDGGAGRPPAAEEVAVADDDLLAVRLVAQEEGVGLVHPVVGDHGEEVMRQVEGLAVGEDARIPEGIDPEDSGIGQVAVIRGVAVMRNRELASEGFTPPTAIPMRLTDDYRGVAATMGGRIVGSVEYFRRHQDDMGAMGPVRLRDVDEAQAIMVSTAKDLAAKGEIMITKNRADDELVY